MPDPRPTPTPRVVFTPEEIAIISQYMPRATANPDQPPLPPHPGIFQPGPMTQGPAGLSAALLAIQKTFPWLTQNTPTRRIAEGITKDSTDDIEESNQFNKTMIDPLQFALFNLYGLHNTRTHDITVRPELTPVDRRQTLVHELLHAFGYPERVTSEMTNRLNKLQVAK